jgi:hypothetical protein
VTGDLDLLVKDLPFKEISRDGSVYMIRYTLCERPEGRTYVHRIYRPDGDDDPHNHPWQATARILSGGYDEELWSDDGSGFVTIKRRAGLPPHPINLSAYHRIVHVRPDTWTLFTVGPKHRDWGFFDQKLDRHVPWREYLTARGVTLNPKEM